MSEIEFENELINKCIKIIDAETKPITTKQSKNAIAIFQKRQAIKMLNRNISRTPTNIHALGMQPSLIFPTASNTNAQ